MARSSVFDLHPDRSLARFLTDRGFAVYLVDWGEPGRSHRELRVGDYVHRWLPAALHAIGQDAGAAAVPVGYCLGGLFCCWTLALQDSLEDTPGLAVIASPSDSHRMGALVATGRQLWKPADLVGQLLGNIPGSLCSLAFQITSPSGFATRWLQRLGGSSGDARGAEYGAIDAWVRDFSALPQGIFRQLLVELIRDNRAFRGQLDVEGEPVDLGRLRLPILAIGGASDRIVAAPAVHAIAEVVGSDHVECRTAPGGHAGVLIGARSRDETWRYLAQWLGRRCKGAGG